MLLGQRLENFTRTVTWNLTLLTVGSLIYTCGINFAALPHGFISGGLYGLGLLGYYGTHLSTPGMWFLALNAPLFILGAVFVSRRFFFYSLYGVLCLSAWSSVVPVANGIHDTMLAAVVGGVLCGAGMGTMLRSFGSSGGLDIIAVILHERFALRIGQFTFAVNVLLFSVSFLRMDADHVLYSMVMAFIIAVVADNFIALFNQRKMIFVISDHNDEIAQTVIKKLRRGATFLHGRGAYSGERKKVLLCVVNNYQLKKMETLVYNIDPHAFIIVENTFNVLGIGFSRRKVY